MVSIFQGLGLAAGSFSDVIEEKQKQRDLATREERIAKRDRAWQLEDFEKKIALAREKEESERLKKEQEAERASQAFARVNGINSQAWSTLTREEQKVFRDSLKLYPGMTGSEVWNLSYNQNTGNLALPPIPKKAEARPTLSNIQADAVLTLFKPNATEKERENAQKILDTIKGLDESTAKGLGKDSIPYAVGVYSKMFGQVNANMKFDPKTNAIIYEDGVENILDKENFPKIFQSGTALNPDTYRMMAKVFTVFRNEADTHSQMIQLSDAVANNYLEGTQNNEYFKRKVIENQMATQEAVSNLVNSVTITNDFITKKLEGVSDKNDVQNQFGALAISNSDRLKNYLSQVYLNGISTIDNIDLYVDPQKTYKTFFDGKVVQFKINMVEEGEKLFPSYTDTQGNPIDPRSPLGKYISEGPTS